MKKRITFVVLILALITALSPIGTLHAQQASVAPSSQTTLYQKTLVNWKTVYDSNNQLMFKYEQSLLWKWDSSGIRYWLVVPKGTVYQSQCIYEGSGNYGQYGGYFQSYYEYRGVGLFRCSGTRYYVEIDQTVRSDGTFSVTMAVWHT